MKPLKNEYVLYMLLGIICPIIISIYYLENIACLEAIASEIFAALMSVIVGLLAMREYKKMGKPVFHWIAIIYLLPSIAALPVSMIQHRGIDDFLHTRMPAFLTMESFAMAQVIVAVLMLIKYKTGEKR